MADHASHLLNADGSVDHEFDRAGIERRLKDGQFFWLDMHRPGDEDVAMLGEVLGFHPLEQEDAIHFGQRPKLDDYDDNVFLVAYGAAPDEDGLVEVHFFASERYLVTLHHDECPAFDDVRRRHERKAGSLDRPAVLLYRALDAMSDSFFPLLADLDDRIDDLEDRTFTSPDNKVLGEIFALKRFLVGLRKVVTPQRDMFAGLATDPSQLPGIADDDDRYFRDVYDHLIRISDLIDSYRDLLSSAMDVYLSTVSNRLNEVMKQLTVIATIFLPLGFLVGFFGQNFAYLVRNIASPWWFWGAGIGSEVAVVLGLLLMFRRRGWV